MDFIANGQGHGSVAKILLANGMNPEALRTNATLRKDEWKELDDTVIKVTHDRLVGVADIMNAGNVYRTKGLGKTVLEYETESDARDAEINMDGVSRAQNDAPNYELAGLPLPIIHRDFQMSARKLAASRESGEALDTTMAAGAAMKVSDRVETILFQGGGSYKFGGYTLYGYTDFPSRNTTVLSVAWTASGATGATIVADILAMKQKLISDGFYGPFMLYIPTLYETVLDENYVVNYPTTIRQRILDISNISGIKVADKLAVNQVIMVQMTVDVVRMVEGLPPTVLEWDAEGGMLLKFKVMTILVPQLRATQEGDCGICHSAPA